MKTLKLIQNTPEWLEFRKNHIGASDVPVLMGTSKWKIQDGRIKTPYILWQEKLGLLDTTIDNEAVRYGSKMEEPARKVYEMIAGDLFTPTVVIHPEYQFLSASLDGLNFTEDRAVEIKNANAVDHECAINGNVPDKYYPQVQTQLLCTGHAEMDYFSYHKGEGVLVVVKRDNAYIDDIYAKSAKFWDCVSNFIEPELIDDDFIERDDHWKKCAELLYNAKEEKKAIDVEIKSLEQILKDYSEGQNSRAGGYRYTCSTSRGKINYTKIPELVEMDLEQYRGKTIQTWRIKKEKK